MDPTVVRSGLEALYIRMSRIRVGTGSVYLVPGSQYLVVNKNGVIVKIWKKRYAEKRYCGKKEMGSDRTLSSDVDGNGHPVDVTASDG